MLAQEREVFYPLTGRAQDGERCGRSGGFKPKCEKYHLTRGVFTGKLQRIQRGIHHADIRPRRARLQERPLSSRHAQGIAKGGQNNLGPLGEGYGVINPPHGQDTNRAARPVGELDRIGQPVFQPVAENRMRMPPAHFHDRNGFFAEVGKVFSRAGDFRKKLFS